VYQSGTNFCAHRRNFQKNDRRKESRNRRKFAQSGHHALVGLFVPFVKSTFHFIFRSRSETDGSNQNAHEEKELKMSFFFLSFLIFSVFIVYFLISSVFVSFSLPLFVISIVTLSVFSFFYYSLCFPDHLSLSRSTFLSISLEFRRILPLFDFVLRVGIILNHSDLLRDYELQITNYELRPVMIEWKKF
jgi:hypothetical protein